MTITKQTVGLYVTWAGYAFGVVAIILSAHHLSILIPAGIAVAAVFLGRQLEKT